MPSTLQRVPDQAPKKVSQKARAQRSLGDQLTQAGILYESEYLFAPRDANGKPLRRWRFDFRIIGRCACPHDRMRQTNVQIAVEVEGALFFGGRHGGTPSVVRDLEKKQVAAVLGHLH